MTLMQAAFLEASTCPTSISLINKAQRNAKWLMERIRILYNANRVVGIKLTCVVCPLYWAVCARCED